MSTTWPNRGSRSAPTSATLYSNSAYPESQTNKDGTSSANAFYVANSMAPVYPMYVRTPDGNIMHHPTTGQQIFDFGDGQYVPYERNFMSISNPVGDLKNNVHEYLTRPSSPVAGMPT